MTKKTVLIVSLGGTIGAFLTGGLTMFRFWCGPTNYTCWDRLEIISSLLIIFIPILIISVITYFMRVEIFRSWRSLTYVWVPLTIAVVFLTPESELTGLFFDISKGEIAFMFAFLFVIISTILIIIKSLLLRGK